MLLYTENLVDTDAYPFDGRIIAQVPLAGVLVCVGFTIDACWMSAPGWISLMFEQADQISLTCGQAVDNDLTVNQLKSICTQLSLSTEGTQQELIDRIKENLGI